jgi:hypothetical protein
VVAAVGLDCRFRLTLVVNGGPWPRFTGPEPRHIGTLIAVVARDGSGGSEQLYKPDTSTTIASVSDDINYQAQSVLIALSRPKNAEGEPAPMDRRRTGRAASVSGKVAQNAAILTAVVSQGDRPVSTATVGLGSVGAVVGPPSLPLPRTTRFRAQDLRR